MLSSLVRPLTINGLARITPIIPLNPQSNAISRTREDVNDKPRLSYPHPSEHHKNPSIPYSLSNKQDCTIRDKPKELETF
jgi:hypothetical protein